MNPRIRDILTVSFASLIIVVIIVSVILGIFKVSGNQESLTQFLSSTAEGEIGGLTITVGGPFGMWVIAFILLRRVLKETPLGSIKLFINFEDLGTSPPTTPIHFQNARCFYSILSNGEEVETNKVARVQFQRVNPQIQVPYIYVSAPSIENPEFQVRIDYNQNEWFSDSYSPKTGRVEMR